MTKKEYEEYKLKVEEFFSHGLNNLSVKTTEGEAIEPYFSWSPCRCCGTSIGGDRYDCDGYNGTTKEIEEHDCICDDCVYFAEYGELDNKTMMDIEKSEE